MLSHSPKIDFINVYLLFSAQPTCLPLQETGRLRPVIARDSETRREVEKKDGKRGRESKAVIGSEK